MNTEDIVRRLAAVARRIEQTRAVRAMYWLWDQIAHSAATPFVYMACGLVAGMAVHPIAAVPWAWIGCELLASGHYLPGWAKAEREEANGT